MLKRCLPYEIYFSLNKFVFLQRYTFSLSITMSLAIKKADGLCGSSTLVLILFCLVLLSEIGFQ
jgi:hypothetical protein